MKRVTKLKRDSEKVRKLKYQIGGSAGVSYVAPVRVDPMAMGREMAQRVAKEKGLKYTPMFTTPEEYEDYQRRFRQVSGRALGPEDDRNYLKFTSYHPAPEFLPKKLRGYDCINGICGLDEAAGLQWSHAPNAGRYFSNKEFLANIRNGLEDYKVLNDMPDFNGPLEVGDHFILLGQNDVPHHSMKLLDIQRGKDGKPLAYRMIENDGDTRFHNETVIAAEEFKERFFRPKGKPSKEQDIIVARPGKYLWEQMTDAQRQEAERLREEDAKKGYEEWGKSLPRASYDVSGGAPVPVEYAEGGISTEGYRRDSPDRFNDFNVIPSNRISMRDVDHPVLGMDDMGVRQVMLPGVEYVFPGQAVLEVPMGGAAGSKNDKIKYGGQIMKKRKMQQGGSLDRRGNELYQYVPMLPQPQQVLHGEMHRIGPGERGQLRSAPRRVPPPPVRYNIPSIPMPMDTMRPEHDSELLRRAELEDWMRKRAWDAANSEYMQDGGGVDDVYEFNNANKINVMMDPYFSSPFYGYYPAGMMPGYGFSAMMGKPLPRRSYQQGGTLNAALAGATRVNTAPTKYSRKVVQNGRTYYIDEGAGAGVTVPRATGSGTAGKPFEQQMIKYLQSGVPLSKLIQEGHLSEADAIPYRKYDTSQARAVYTDAPPPAPVPRPAPVYDPTMGFDGEPIYNGNMLDAMIRYPAQNSANQPAQVMFVDRNGQYDPTRGYHEMTPAELRRMTGGTRHWQDTTGMYQTRKPVPRDLPAADVVAGRRFQEGGPVRPVAGDTSRAMQAGPSRVYDPGNYVYNQMLRGDSIPEATLQWGPTRRLVNEHMRDSMINNLRNSQQPYLFQQRPQMEFIDPNRLDPRNRPMQWQPLPRRYQDGGTLEEEAIRNAQYVSEAPKTYSRMVQRNNRDYYLTEAEKREQLRRARGSGDGGAGYVKLMQEWASKGIDPNEMAKQGYIHRSRVPEFMAYYKPQMSAVYTAAPSPVPVTNTTPTTGTAQVYDPTAGFDGEPIYDGNRLDAVIRYRGPNSADQDAEVMYVDRNGKYDPSRGFHRVPAKDLRRMTGGTRHWQNRMDMSPYRVAVPGDLPVEDVVGGRRFDAGGPYSGGPYYPFGANPYPSFPGNFFFTMNNPGFQQFMQTPILSKDSQRLQGSSGPLTPSEQQQQEMQAVSNSPGFQQFMQTPILSKDSERLQGTAAPLSEEQLQQQAVQQMFNNPRFQQIMKRGPVLSKDSPRLQDPPDKDPQQQSQTVSYMDPLYGQIGLVGMGAVGNFLDKRNERRALQESKKKNMSDWFGMTVVGSEGDYMPNSGDFRPKDKVAVQFRAYPRGMMMAAEGGTVDPLADVREVPGYLDATVMDVPVIAPPASTEVVEEASVAAPVKQEATKVDNVEPKMDVFVTKNTEKAFDYYVQKGIPAHIAAGITGNTNRESGTDAKRNENKGGPGTGIAQWGDNTKKKDSGGRWNAFLDWAKKVRRNPFRMETQLDYILEEPGWGPETLAKLYQTKTPEEAAMVFMRGYEKPSEKYAAADERIGAALKLYNRHMQRQGKGNQAPQEGRDFNLTKAMGHPTPEEGKGFDLAAAMGLGNVSMDMTGLTGGGSSGGGSEEEDQQEQNMGMAFSDQGLLPLVGADEEEGADSYERGGEYFVTPKQLKFILANGGEIEFL